MTVRLFLLLAVLMMPMMAVAQTVDQEDIVVTAQVGRIGVSLGRNDAGQTTCSLTRSSGNIAIDNALCKRASHCMKRGEPNRTALEACLVRQKKALISAWLKGARS